MTKEDIEKELIYNFAGSESELKAIAEWVYTLLEKEKKKNNSLRLENEDLKAEKNDVYGEVLDIQRELTKLNRESNGLKTELSICLKEREFYKKDLKETQALFYEAMSEISNLKEENNKLKEELKELQYYKDIHERRGDKLNF